MKFGDAIDFLLHGHYACVVIDNIMICAKFADSGKMVMGVSKEFGDPAEKIRYWDPCSLSISYLRNQNWKIWPSFALREKLMPNEIRGYEFVIDLCMDLWLQ